jgi:hypothetical protein
MFKSATDTTNSRQEKRGFFGSLPSCVRRKGVVLTGLPVQGELFKPAKWKEKVSVYLGLPPPETRKSVNQHIIIKGIALSEEK